MKWGRADELVGTTLAERYRIERRIGSGGFGVVFAGTHTWLDIPIAIKVLRMDRIAETDQATAFDAFLSEARTLAQLRHDHIVRILDTGVRHAEGGLPQIPWLVMEWCSGPTLAEDLAARGGRPRSRAATWRIMEPVIAAVAHAHDNDLVHRDLKPANIMLVDGSPRVVDFGIAKLVEEDERAAQDSAATRSDRRAFTPAYAAPEQLAGRRTGTWTDVHALALITTELLTGRRAFGARDSAELMRAQLGEVRPTPASRDVDAGAWEGVLARAMAYAPTNRFADAGKLLAALAEHAPEHDTTISSRPPHQGADTEPDTTMLTGEPMALPPPAAPSRRVPGARWKLVVAATAALAAGSFGWWARIKTRQPATLAPSPARTIYVEDVRAGVHPHDGYNVGLVHARLRAAGWTSITDEHQDESEWSAARRIVATSEVGKAVILVQRWRRSRHLEPAEAQMRSSPGLALRRRGTTLLAVQVTDGKTSADDLLALLARTEPSATVGGVAARLSTPGWERFDVPTGVDLTTLWGTDSHNVYAAGAHGVILSFDGERWHREASGVTHDLTAITGIGNDVFIVGLHGTILRRDGGGWTLEPSGTSEHLYAVGAMHGSPPRILAGGARGTVAEREAGKWASSNTGAGNDLVGVVGGNQPSLISVTGGLYASRKPGEFVLQPHWPVDEHGLPRLFIHDSLWDTAIMNPAVPWPAPWSSIDWKPRDYVRMPGAILVVGTSGIVFRATDGLLWNKTELGITEDLTGVWAAPDGAVFVVGTGGTVLRHAAQSHVE